jgi:hypothetical protein
MSFPGAVWWEGQMRDRRGGRVGLGSDGHMFGLCDHGAYQRDPLCIGDLCK